MSWFKTLSTKIDNFFKVFGRPHHSSTLSIRGLVSSVLVALIVASVALLFKPFGLQSLQSEELLNIAVTIAGIAFLAMLLLQFLFPLVIKDFYSEESWTTGKQFSQLLMMSFLICITTVYYVSGKGLVSFPVDAFILFGASILPLLIVAVIQQKMLNETFASRAAQKNTELNRKDTLVHDNPLKVLTFGKSKLSLIPNQLIYIKIGQPSRFYFQNMLGINEQDILMSRKEIEKELGDLPQFVSFGNDVIVNINAIQNVTGSARGYEFQIARVNELVSVSQKDKKKFERI